MGRGKFKRRKGNPDALLKADSAKTEQELQQELGIEEDGVDVKSDGLKNGIKMEVDEEANA